MTSAERKVCNNGDGMEPDEDTGFTILSIFISDVWK
jgi:hypothetical protein